MNKRITLIGKGSNNQVVDVYITTNKICKRLKDISYYKVMQLINNGWKSNSLQEHSQQI